MQGDWRELRVVSFDLDTALWREDRGVRRKAKGARNLALLRNAILALLRPEEHASHNQAFLHYADHRSDAIRLLTQMPPYDA